MANQQTGDDRLRVESESHSLEEQLGVVFGGVNKPVEQELLFLSLELADVDLPGVADNVLENATSDASVGGQPLQRGPPQRLLVLPFLPKRRRPRKRILRRVPHSIIIGSS